MASTPRLKWIFASIAVLLAWPTTASSEEIPTVTLTDSGPDRDIPAGKAFYLVGVAKEATVRVQPVILRKGLRFVFGNDGPTCTKLLTDLGELKKNAKGEPNDLAFTAGVHDASELWLGADDKVLTPAPWDRGSESGDAHFKILIPADPDFFRSGASYCLTVFERIRTKKSDDATVRNLLFNYADELDKCHTDSHQDRAKCETQATTNYEAGFTNGLAHVSSAERGRLRTAADQIVDAASSLRTHGRVLASRLETWGAAYRPQPGPSFMRRPELPYFWSISGDPMGRAVATLAARNGALRPESVARTLGGRTVSGNEYFTPDGKVTVQQIGVLESLDVLRVAGPGDNNKNLNLEVKTGEILLPQGGVSLLDLLMLTQGRIRIGDEELELKVLAERLRGHLAAPEKFSAATLAHVDAAAKKIRALDVVFQRAFAASSGFNCATGYPGNHVKPMEGTSKAVEAALGEWLRCEVVVECSPELATSLELDTKEAGCGAEPSAWPKFKKIGRSPLAQIVVDLEMLSSSHAEWNAAKAALAIIEITHTNRTRTRPLETKLAFTQETWIFTYLTPVVGYAYFHDLDPSFTRSYFGLQLHLWPNPVDDPLWSHGFQDLERAFALEVGFARDPGAFGPENRFRGWGGLPPLFVGAAIHVIPYTSFTAGVSVVERRTTTLGQEQHHRFVTPYFGLNVQFNVPDAISALVGRSSKTTTEK